MVAAINDIAYPTLGWNPRCNRERRERATDIGMLRIRDISL